MTVGDGIMKSGVYAYDDELLHLVIEGDAGWKTLCGIEPDYPYTRRKGKAVVAAVTCGECLRIISQVRQHTGIIRAKSLH